MDTLLPSPIEEKSSAPTSGIKKGKLLFVFTLSSCRQVPMNVWPLVGMLLVTQSCLTLCNPVDYIACQAPLSMEFSRQEYWSVWPLVNFY